MGKPEVTSNHEVSDMIKKPITDPVACTGNIMSIQDALDVLGNKWSILIIHYLLSRETEINTFKKIEKDMNGISAKMLSKELKTLEINKMVKRDILDTKPVSVQYTITSYGKEVKPVIATLVDWGQRHRDMMKTLWP